LRSTRAGSGAAALAVEDRHLARVVAVAGHGLRRQRPLDRRDINAVDLEAYGIASNIAVVPFEICD
jgi:hypothetical protein